MSIKKKIDRFSLRKYPVGLCSVMLGSGLVAVNSMITPVSASVSDGDFRSALIEGTDRLGHYGGQVAIDTVIHFIDYDTGQELGQKSGTTFWLAYLKGDGSSDARWYYKDGQYNDWRYTTQLIVYCDLPMLQEYYPERSDLESPPPDIYGQSTGQWFIFRYDMWNSKTDPRGTTREAGATIANRLSRSESTGEIRHETENFYVRYHKREAYKPGQGTPLSTRNLTITEGQAAPDADDYIANSLPSHTASITSGPSAGSYPSAGTYTVNIGVDYYDRSHADGTATLTVLPSGHSVSQSKTITVNYNLTNVPSQYQDQVKSQFGGSLSKTDTFQVSRSGFEYNSGGTTWDDWSVTSHNGPSVPDIAGYSHTNFGSLTINPNSNDTYNVTASYTPNTQTGHVYYIDDDDNGKTAKTVTFTGKTDETVATNATLPDNYELAPGASNVTSATMKASGNDYQVHVKHKTQVIGDDGSTKHNVTRTITVHDPHNGNHVTTQNVQLKRSVVLDLVTNQRHNGNWVPVSGDGILPAFTAPTVAGYTPSKSVAALTVTGDTPETIDEDITYHADGKSGYVALIDDDNNQVEIKRFNFSGTTDQTVQTGAVLSANYHLVPGQNLPSSVVLKPNDQDNIYLVHVAHDRLNTGAIDIGARKTVTRTITVVDPHTGEHVTTQTAYLARSAELDLVTNKTTYGTWHKDSSKPDTLPLFTTPVVAGYTPSQDSVQTLTITGDTDTNLQVRITYTANDGTQTINYVGDGKTIHSQVLHGKTDQTVPVTSEVPDGWQLDNSTVPTSVTIKPTDTPIIVNIKHVQDFVDHRYPVNPGTPVPGTKTKTYPGGLTDSDLNRKVTQTIIVKHPANGKHGADETYTKVITFYHDATYDAVTGQITYTNWTEEGDKDGEHFTSQDIAKIAGYDLTNTSSDAVHVDSDSSHYHLSSSTKVTPDTSNYTTTFAFTARARQNTVHIFDDTDNKEVTTFQINGHTDDLVTFDPMTHIASGYEFVSGPKSYLFEGDTDTPITVHVRHGIIHDTTKKITGEPIPDIDRTVIRKITIIKPGFAPIDKSQSAQFHRTADVDKVTGKWTYNAWSAPVDLPKVNVDQVEGYTPNITFIPAITVNQDSHPSPIVVTYVPNYSDQTYIFHDTETNTTVGRQTVTGKVDQNVPVSLTVPDGYAADSPLPTSTMIHVDNPDITINVHHVKVHIPGPSDHDRYGQIIPGTTGKLFPEGASNKHLQRSIKRVITYKLPTGDQVVTQTVTATRGATVDAATGQVVYDAWTVTNPAKFAAADSIKVPGYVPNPVSVPEYTPNFDSDPDVINVTVNYDAGDSQQTIAFVDDTNRQEVARKTFKGKTGQKVDVTGLTVPDGYVADVPVPETVKIPAVDDPIIIGVHHLEVYVAPDYPKDEGTLIPGTRQQRFPKGVDYQGLHKTVTRTINFHKPSGVETVVQKVNYKRGAVVDAVTKQITYYTWEADGTETLPAVTSPLVPGYIASQATVPALTPNPDVDSNIVVDVTYEAGNAKQTIIFVDPDHNPVSSYTIGGKTGETHNVPTDIVPDGWETDEPLPKDVTLKATDTPIEIPVHHKHITVLHTKPLDEGTPIPGTQKVIPLGVSDKDLNKTLTRTIIVHKPDGTTDKVTQTVKVHRDADIDLVTGKITYTPWTFDEPKSFPEYTVPVIPGYTASQDKVSPLTPDPDTFKDQIVDITYKASDGKQTVRYVDPSGDVVGTQTVTGKTGEDVAFTPNLPDGYELAKPAPKSFVIPAVDKPIDLQVVHKHVTVLHTHPHDEGETIPGTNKKYPKGVSDKDLNKTLTRTIAVHKPDGTTENITQTVKVHRDADVDVVTGTVTYTPWVVDDPKSFPEYTVPVIPGYTASQDKVPALTPDPDIFKDQTVDITYKAGDGKQTVRYVDPSGGVVGTQTVTGKTGEDVAFTPSLPDGYELAKPAPKSFVIPAADKPIDLQVVHKHVTVTHDKPHDEGETIPGTNRKYPKGVSDKDLNKTLTRTITVHKPDGTTETVKQTLRFHRDADVDVVTGVVTYTPWVSDGDKTFTRYDVPAVSGYIPSQEFVPALTPNPETFTDQTVDITYTAGDNKQTIRYVDPSGNVVGTQTVAGKTGENVAFTPNLPDGYELAKPAPKSFTIPAVDKPIDLEVVHKHVTVTHDHPHNAGDKIDGTNKTYPDGVSDKDLNNTLTRTITVHLPNGQTKVVTQLLHFYRDADVDVVTGVVTYTTWKTDGETSFAKYVVPVVAGYTPSQSAVNAFAPDPDKFKDQAIDITYTANAGTQTIHYVDSTGHVVSVQVLRGHTGDKLAFKPDIPAGYELVDTVPNDLEIKAVDTPISFKIRKKATSKAKTPSTVKVSAPVNTIMQVNASAPTKASTLPQTGDTDSVAEFALAGTLTSLALLALKIRGKKRED